MKILSTIIILIFSITLMGAQNIIAYNHTYDDVFENQELKADISGQVHVLIGKEDKLCFKIEKIADFNKNGFEDVLVRIINGCGGNCCADSYQIFSYNGQFFKESEIVGYDWDGIEIIKSTAGYQFIVETVYEGFGNSAMCHNKVETFRLKDHDFELLNVVEDQKLSALLELKASDFEGKEDEVLLLKFDLNGDGKMDTLSCRYWPRWGRMFEWKINFGNGKAFEGSTTPKRIGIMATKTNNVHDLVLECDEILKWNGREYE